MERYADVEAVRVMPSAYRGWSVIKSAWARYHLPIALTEVHIGLYQGGATALVPGSPPGSEQSAHGRL